MAATVLQPLRQPPSTVVDDLDLTPDPGCNRHQQDYCIFMFFGIQS